MTQLMVLDQPMVMAANPWCQVGMCKRGRYLRNPVPWDRRRQHLAGLSDAQRDRVDAFIDVASDPGTWRECEDKTGMAFNACRVRAIGRRLRGRPERPRRRVRRARRRVRRRAPEFEIEELGF